MAVSGQFLVALAIFPRTARADNHVGAPVTRPVVGERMHVKKLFAISTLAITLGLLAGTVAAAHAATGPPPTQSNWNACRQTDTFYACCKHFGGDVGNNGATQSCTWSPGNWARNNDPNNGAPGRYDYGHGPSGGWGYDNGAQGTPSNGGTPPRRK
jgi:hypothetical protein